MQINHNAATRLQEQIGSLRMGPRGKYMCTMCINI